MTIIHRHLILSFIALIFASTAWGQRADSSRRFDRQEPRQRIIIPMHDQLFQGRDNRVFLKQEIKRQDPRLRLMDYDIVKVRLIAKSRHGRGQAELLVAGRSQDRQTVYAPGDFFDSSPGSFDRLELDNRSDQQGPWQLSLSGQIKVRRIVVILEQRRQWPPRVIEHVVGTHRADKRFEDRAEFNRRYEGVEQIVIQGTRGRVEVLRFVVVFGNGERMILGGLEGQIRDGQTKNIYLGGRTIERIISTATTDYLVGPTGEYEIRVLASERGRRR